jgi:hypothetical protein
MLRNVRDGGLVDPLRLAIMGARATHTSKGPNLGKPLAEAQHEAPIA